MSDVGTCHIASNHHFVGVMRTNRSVEHRATPAWSDNRKFVGMGLEAQDGDEEKRDRYDDVFAYICFCHI